MFRISACTELPDGWTKLKTDPDFPVDNGATFLVSCRNRYIDIGSLELTCNTNIFGDMEYKKKLKCFPSEFVGKS